MGWGPLWFCGMFSGLMKLIEDCFMKSPALAVQVIAFCGFSLHTALVLLILPGKSSDRKTDKFCFHI